MLCRLWVVVLQSNRFRHRLSHRPQTEHYPNSNRIQQQQTCPQILPLPVQQVVHCHRLHISLRYQHSVAKLQHLEYRSEPQSSY